MLPRMLCRRIKLNWSKLGKCPIESVHVATDAVDRIVINIFMNTTAKFGKNTVATLICANYGN